MNHLYYGDNLDILRRHIPDESVDLIYLDPPFKSNQDYNILFVEKSGARAASQIKVFEDTWEWNTESSLAFTEIVQAGGRVSQVMQAFRTFLGENDMMAYLAMMAPRLVELHRVLKPTGSIYLHCDPAASHYLKLLMDSIFGVANFLNEVVWKRTFAHGSSKRWGPVHDVILFYSKSDEYIWNRQFQIFEESYLRTKYRYHDEKGRYRLVVLTAPGVRHGDSGKSWKGYDPTVIGRHWAVPQKLLREAIGDISGAGMTIQEDLDLLEERGMIRWTKKADGALGTPESKLYLPEGVLIQDVASDIFPINSQAQERLGYPTQKPEALLDRIIQASSNPGDIVLDPFCGCGTAIAAAQRLGRCWIGIDVTHLAISLIRHRLQTAFGKDIAKTYKVTGEPTTVEEAAALIADDDRYQFQWWALGLVGARPEPKGQKKGADKGIDGRLYFVDDVQSGKASQVIISVKSGGTSSRDIRDLRGVIDREKAAIGVMITLEEPTRDMRKEAAAADFYETPFGKQKFPRLQILTIAELLDGKRIDMPWQHLTGATFKPAPKAKKAKPDETPDLFEE